MLFFTRKRDRNLKNKFDNLMLNINGFIGLCLRFGKSVTDGLIRHATSILYPLYRARLLSALLLKCRSCMLINLKFRLLRLTLVDYYELCFLRLSFINFYKQSASVCLIQRRNLKFNRYSNLQSKLSLNEFSFLTDLSQVLVFINCLWIQAKSQS